MLFQVKILNYDYYLHLIDDDDDDDDYLLLKVMIHDMLQVYQDYIMDNVDD